MSEPSKPQEPEFEDVVLPPGVLWERLIQRTQQALQCGALQPIPTHYTFVEQEGVAFLVRTLANLRRKAAAKKAQETTADKDFNPFLPYDPDLFVTHLSKTHLALLNKFNVVDHHLLIVTRAFESQETWLTAQDFAALWACLAEFDGLGFYNGGQIAGASQRHKHLQLVPLPMISDTDLDSPRLPIEPLLNDAQFTDEIGVAPGLPFRHAIARLDPDWLQAPLSAAPAILEQYHRLLDAVGLKVEGATQTGAYNFLTTRNWMLVVPRSQEHFESISVNSLGFAGSLFVRDDEQMARLRAYGPMNVLRHVTQG